MEEIALEQFIQNGVCDKAMMIKKGDEEVCVVLNSEDLLLDLVVPKMESCVIGSIPSQSDKGAGGAESLAAMKAKAQEISQTITMDK